MRSVFQSLSDGQIKCILLIDEVCVKPMLLYHGGQLIHHSVRSNTQLVKSFVLVFMIVCLYGGPKLLVKTLPITRLDTNFLYDQSKMLIDQIKDCGGNLAAVIICDNNCVNPVFFKRFHAFRFGEQRATYFYFLISFTSIKVFGIIGTAQNSRIRI